MSATERVRVELGARSYEVWIGPNVIDAVGQEARALGAGRCAILTDAHVAPLWAERVQAALAAAGLPSELIILPPGEGAKSFVEFQRVCEAVLAQGLERRDLILALGGGVVGDLAGFVAGVLKRGMDFIQIPTSLLAQVDSSVGGKTGINAAGGKNLIGLFHQPRLVLADTETLASLPARELRAGFAEVIKYGLIDDPRLFAWCAAHGQAALAGDGPVLAEAVAASVRAKARIVAADEREHGARALLNLGHTFAHALEASAGYDGSLLHGEAVGCGMALAFAFSVKLGLCAQSEADTVRTVLGQFGYGVRIAELPGGPYAPSELLAAMDQDKKNEGGEITLILARGIGAAFVHKRASRDRLAEFLQEHITP